jgi:hypothetical protein
MPPTRIVVILNNIIFLLALHAHLRARFVRTIMPPNLTSIRISQFPTTRPHEALWEIVPAIFDSAVDVFVVINPEVL